MRTFILSTYTPKYSKKFPLFPPGINESYLIDDLGLDNAGYDLFSRMLEYYPKKRISAKEAALHPYFDELYEPGIKEAYAQNSILGR